MLHRTTAIVSREQSKAFKEFLRNNAKDRNFWREVEKTASSPVDKKELDKLFK